MTPAPEIRRIGEADHRAWLDALNRGFLRPPAPVGAEDVPTWFTALGVDEERTVGAFDGGRCVGTFRSMPRELTVPGGATLPACAITSVTVTATHRRRGLLTAMMGGELARCRERGEPLAILIAAEYPIYGRFGFGPATWVTDWLVDIPRARRGRDLGLEGGRIDLVDAAEIRKAGPELHERVRRSTPGAINRPETWWRVNTGDLRLPGRPEWTELFYAVYRDAAGRVDGLLAYTVDDVWEAKLPQDTLTVKNLIAATPQAERALWRYALSVDWVTKLASGHRPPDDLLPLLLGDPRAARIASHADFMWVRILDVERALAARSYAGSDTLVIEVRDAAGLSGGRYELDAAPRGASVRTTTRPADLALDVAELGCLYLGDESAVRLAALGRVEELRPGAAARADALLRTPRRPWCPDTF